MMSQNAEKTHQRRRPVKKIIGGVLALVLIPTAAWAAYVLLFGATGSVSTASVDYDITATYPAQPTTAEICSPSNTDTETFKITAGKMFPGDTCTVQVSLEPQGTQDATMVLQGVEFVTNESIVTAVASTSLTKCGESFDSGKGAMLVNLTVRMKETGVMGQSFPADAEAGIKLVPQGQYDPSKCLTFAQDGTVNPAG